MVLYPEETRSSFYLEVAAFSHVDRGLQSNIREGKTELFILLWWKNFPCPWHPFVFLQCLGHGFCPVTGCLKWPFYLRLPQPIFSFLFALLIALLLTLHSLIFLPCLFLVPCPHYHSLLPLYGKKRQHTWFLKKKKKKSKQAWSRQAQHKTCLCSWSLKTISFVLGIWVGSRGCASFVLIQYFSIRGCGSLWVSTVGFYCCVRY